MEGVSTTLDTNGKGAFLHALNANLVRAYDLRGRVGTDLSDADAHALGSRVAAAVLARGGRVVATGYDGRLSSPALEAALADGLAVGGVTVERVGLGPVGLLYHAVHSRGLDGGVMVTGSHNPADQNGFKVLLGTEPVYGEALRALTLDPHPSPRTCSGVHRGARAHSAEPAPRRMPERVRHDGGGDGLADDYLHRLLHVAQGAPPLRIGWDAGNGATGATVERLTARLPGHHRLLHCAIDGRFPAHHPDPSDPANLSDLIALVRAEGLDLGIAFDGDGDRIGVVDRTGAIVWPDQLLLYLAEDLLARLPGAAVVADVKSSRVLFDGVATAGGRTVLAPSGYVLIRERMIAEGAPIAGEMSGHLFFAEGWNGTDDAIHVAMRLLSAIGRRGDLTDWRAGLPRTYATPDLRLPCPDDRKVPVLAAVEAALVAESAAIDRTDGLRVTTSGGWWLLRASGTEPKLTARVEAWTPDGLERLHDALIRRLQAADL